MGKGREGKGKRQDTGKFPTPQSLDAFPVFGAGAFDRLVVVPWSEVYVVEGHFFFFPFFFLGVGF